MMRKLVLEPDAEKRQAAARFHYVEVTPTMIDAAWEAIADWDLDIPDANRFFAAIFQAMDQRRVRSGG
jgi:hypothetical protein